jgi:hypothetical protein
MTKRRKAMPRIDATITATDPGGQVNLTIDKNPINVPRGQHDIVFRLDDQTTQGPTKFDTGDPIFYARGNTCPSSGKNCPELGVQSCTDTLLTVGDNNGGPLTIGYQLNFKYANKKEQLDPIIINT